MSKKAISVTLDEVNVLWLKARVTARNGRGVSEILDELVTTARAGSPSGTTRSVVGTIDIASDDPGLERADAHVRVLFDRSVARPFVVREDAPAYGRKRKKRG